jgi:DNA-binding winged helix-turn-helix (wHTH) protein/tetratricopeptide (TPR) repeat protein
MFEIYSFANFQLHKKKRTLYEQGQPVQISQRALEILLFLVERQGQIVTKETLLEAIWPESFVEESNLAVQINALRTCLGDKRGEYRFIQTISGKGYCFIADVRKEEVEISPVMPTSVKPPEEDLSIAVLPFLYRGEDSDIEFLADGITESLISNLSQLPQLKVMAYSAVASYKGKEIDVQETAFILGVGKILSGKISKLGDQVEVSVELINAADLSQIWGEQYALVPEDLFILKKEISVRIVESLKLKLTNSETTRLDKQYTSSTTAYKLYLQGRFLMDDRTQPNLLKSIKCFEQALKIDPKFALAYTGIADAYNFLGNFYFLPAAQVVPKVKSSIQMALSLDQNLSEAYSSLGFLHLYYDYSPKTIADALEKSLELNPNNALANSRYSVYFVNLRNYEKCFYYQQKALDLDTLSITFNGGLAARFIVFNEYSKAIMQSDEVLALYPKYHYGYYYLAFSLAQMGVFDEALNNINKAVSINDSLEILSMKGYILALSGDKNEARTILQQILIKSKTTPIDFMDIGAIYAALDEKDKAFEYLEKARQARMNHFCILNVDPRFDNLRSDARFSEFLKTIGLNVIQS